MRAKANDFYPTIYEVELANHVFKRELKAFEESEELPKGFAENIAVKCSIARVWSRARMYQEEMEVSK